MINFKTRGTKQFLYEKRIIVDAAKYLYGDSAMEEIKKIEAPTEKEWLFAASKVNERHRRRVFA